MTSGLLFVLLLGIGGNLVSEAEGVHVTICEHAQLTISCRPLFAIRIFIANYGRHDSTTCSENIPPSQLQNTSCSLPTNIVGQNCNDKGSCLLYADNSVFGDPCVGTSKYLEVDYYCYFTLQ